MNEYLKAQMKTNSAIINSSFSLDELHRFSKSDYRWADNRSKNFQLYKVKKGEIYQFEFGKNFIPEMSYEHRGLVIGINKNYFMFFQSSHTILNVILMFITLLIFLIPKVIFIC